LASGSYQVLTLLHLIRGAFHGVSGIVHLVHNQVYQLPNLSSGLGGAFSELTYGVGNNGKSPTEMLIMP